MDHSTSSRRRRGGLRAIIGLATGVSLLLAACGSDSGSAPTSAGAPSTTAASSSGSTSAATTATKFDRTKFNLDATLNIAYNGPSPTLDPHLFSFSTYPTWVYPIYDRLFAVDAGGSAMPMLAKSYKFSDDGKTLTLTLRDDAVFHDGTPVDAAAVKASLERGKTIQGSTVSTSLRGISAIVVVDPHTVALTLDGAGAELIAVLASSAGVVMNPKVISDPSVDLASAPPIGAGSGPYVVTKSQPNVSTTYQRAPQYWDPSKALLKGYTVSLVAQGATRVSGLQAGDFDMVAVSSDNLEQVVADGAAGKFKVFKFVGASKDMFLNIQSGDLADINVRKAISLAIDRDQVNVASPGEENSQPQPKGHWAHNPDIKNVFDPAQAKALIAARGGAKFELVVGSGTSYEVISQVIQPQLAAVGITMSIRMTEQAQTTPQFVSGQAQAFFGSIQPGVDPAEPVNRYFFGTEKLAKGAVGDQLHALADPASNPNLTQDQRATIYRKVFQFIADRYMYIPVNRGYAAWAYTKDIAGLDQMPGRGNSTPDMTGIGVLAR